MSTVVKYLFVIIKVPGKIKWSQVNLLKTEVDLKCINSVRTTQ